MFTQLLLFLIATTLTLADDPVFEDSRELCSKKCVCELSKDNSTLYINCESKLMKHTIANWPDHPSHLMATFKNNTIVTLEKVPGSDAEDLKLTYSHCKIKYIATGLLGSAINTKYLDLSHNEIESEQLSADVFKGPYNNTSYEPIKLEHLDLSYNRIHSLQKNVFIHTPHLKYLSLEGNRMRIIDHVTCLALAKVPKMQFLNLANNKFTEIPGDALKHFPNLTEINLAVNELDFVPEALGYAAESLQLLNVSNNPIIEFEQRTFEGLERILKLFANNLEQITVIRAEAFSPLKSLRTLQLSHCHKLDEIDEDAFKNLQHLEEVYINDDNLKTMSPKLLPWNDLRIVDVRNNQFICNCDLFQISMLLPSFLKTGVNVPLCTDQRTLLSIEIGMMTNETCSYRSSRREIITYNNFRLMRITMVSLVFMLIISAMLATWLGYTKWKSYRRTLSYPFPNQIVYSPVSSSYKH
ncbi:hypothetical protein FQR65_LT12038 [Abscondita terminalis]|nr:hypothetical protein FQR65_LT12038 [Abscondita terminalis]